MNLGNVLILGDSYSTFEGYIPKGYATYYYPERSDIDVSRVDETWWMQLINETQSNLVLNCSWSGTTICNTGYSGDCTHNSFITRFDELAAKDFFKQNKIDTLFIFGGTNDTWASSPVGELKFSGWSRQELFSVLPAFCYLLDRIKTELPKTRVLCIVNTGLKWEIVDGMNNACENYRVDEIILENIDKQSGHPNKSGMTQIKQQILNYLEK